MLVACSTERADDLRQPPSKENAIEPGAQRYGYRVAEVLPHDDQAFTQGLVVYKGAFLESTGQYGFSSLRRAAIKNGVVQRSEKVDARYFAEGIAVLQDRVYMLTWLNQQGFIYDAKTLAKVGDFTYQGEGWGLTTDGIHLYMSNGTSTISVHDPNGFRRIRSFDVLLDGVPLNNLNELEWIHGEIWANVWQSETVVRINPTTGRVVGVVDFSGILPQSDRSPSTDVMNGIAWDSVSQHLYVTGKHWPKVFRVEVQ